MYDQQLLANTRHRAELELEKSERLFNVNRATDQHNLQAAEERKRREKLEREQQLEEERRELDLLNQRKVKRVLPNGN